MSEQPQATTPTLPAPVEPPEYYTGFGVEFEQIGLELQDIYQRLQIAERNLPKPLPVPSGILGRIQRWFNPVAFAISEDPRVQKMVEEAQVEFDAAAVSFQLAEWKLEIMQVLPMYLSDPNYIIENPGDILQYVAPGVELTAADTAWLNETYGKLEHLSNVLPEGYQGDVLDAQKQVLNEILTEPKLEMIGVHRLTVDEIAKAFTFNVAELPENLTVEDVRNILSQMGIDDEELLSQQEWLRERAREWEIESTRMSLIRASEILAESPELAPLEWTKLMFTQPMMATVELMQKWWDAVSRPISAAITMNLPPAVAGAVHGAPIGVAAGGMAGAAIGAFGGPIGMGVGAIIGLIAGAVGGAALFSAFETEADKELTVHYEFYRGQGESAWSSYAKAFNAWDAPWWKKMILDSAYDPLMWIGWGGIAAVGSKLTKMALPRGLKWAGSRIGTLMVAFEQGYVSSIDDIFRFGVRVLAAPIKSAFWLTGAGYTIPATFTQMSRRFSQQGIKDFFAVVGRTYKDIRGKFGVGMTGKDAGEVVEASIQAALKNPELGTTPAVRLGTSLMEFNYLDDVAAAKFLKGFVPADAVFDTPRLARINAQLCDTFSIQGNKITAGNILSIMNMSDVPDKVVVKLASGITKFKEGVAATAINAVKGETADQVIKRIGIHLELSRYNNLHSPLTKWMQQAGRSASWHSRVADKVLYSARLVAFERRVVMPVARWQLLFANFGPYNYLENSGRSFLGGGELLYPKAFGGVDEALRVFRGLAGTDYDLIMAQRGMRRLTQAVVDPKTGTTAVFKGGKVPFVTKRVRIPEKIPRWGGNYLGKTMTIGDKSYFLGSAQDWYDMWADLTMKQNAYDLQVHFLTALQDIAPDDMAGIYKVISNNKHLLDDVHSITKREAFDIDREMGLEIIGGGPESVRAFADVDVITMQRRQIAMRFKRDTADKMEDVRGIVKRGVDDEILDGTMFTKGHQSIDERMDAFVSASRELEISSLAPQMESIKDDVAGFIANPPKNLDDFMGDMQNLTSHIEAVGETIHDFRKITRIRAAGLFVNEADDFEVGSAKMLAEYMDTAESELVEMMNQLMKNARAPRGGVLEHWTTPASAKSIRAEGFRVSPEEGMFGKGVYFYPRGVAVREPTKGVEEIVSATTSAKLYDVDLMHPSQDLLGRLKVKSIDYEGFYEDIAARVPDIYPALRKEGYGGVNIITEGVPQDIFPAGGNQVLVFSSRDVSVLTGKEAGVLTDVQLARLTDLDNISRLELNNILATRTKIAGIEAEIPDFHKTVRKIWKSDPDKAEAMSKNFWSSQKARKADMWDEFDGIAGRLKSDRLLTSRNFLTSVDKSVYVPDFVPEVVGELTPNHLAYLYGCTGDDLYRGLTRIQHNTRIRPRQDFIIHTRDYANAYAAKFGKTGAELGFTDEAIGEVYDQLCRNLGWNPSILTPDHPTMMQMEEMRQEIHRMYDVTKIADSDVVKWRKYINGVADEAEQLGAFKVAPVVEEIPSLKAINAATTTSEAEDLFKPISAISDTYEKRLQRYMPDLRKDSVLARIYADNARLTAGPTSVESWRALAMNEVKTIKRIKNLLPKFEPAPPRVPPVAEGISGTPDWWAKKEQAMTKAKEMHYLAYPNYEDANILDETMRAIFPFWNYELFRWKWLPRTALRTPGVMSGLARFMDYTDQGYTSVPGTDLQINPLRGTVFMGGLRSFYLRDFPEFHDPIPGIEFLDYIGRAGFFPGIHVMFPVVGLSSMVSGQPLQIGELLPAWMKTSLSALRALSPEHIGNVLQYIYPDRFRDYMTMMQLAAMGYDGDEIWKKKQQGQKLTEEEEKLWLQATNKVDGIKGVLMNQTGLFRIRPQEFTQIRKEMRLAIEEATGVPVKTQEWIDKMYPVTGKRFTDYFHLDVQQQALLYQWESYRRYQGIITPLYPSSWQGLDIKISDYYAELERVFTDARYNGVYQNGELVQQSMLEINRQLVEGIIGPDQWRSLRSRMQEGLSAAADALGNSPAYKDVPKTFDERAAMLEERGIVTPTQTPDQELLYYYYELKPELKYNWESDRMELDFDTYYAYIDALLEALAPAYRERLLERIQNDWTPMEKLYWQFSRDFARPYRNLKTVVLNEYTDEQVMIIRRFEVARGTEREEIKNVEGPDGKLISGYQKRLREARQRFRILDPTLDAWLYFFGTTDKFMSHESEEIYNELTKQYLTPAMIGVAK